MKAVERIRTTVQSQQKSSGQQRKAGGGTGAVSGRRSGAAAAAESTLEAQLEKTRLLPETLEEVYGWEVLEVGEDRQPAKLPPPKLHVLPLPAAARRRIGKPPAPRMARPAVPRWEEAGQTPRARTRRERKGPRNLRLELHLLVLLVILGPAVASAAYWMGMKETVAARGRIDFTRLAPVSTRISARIEQVLCREGQSVRKGDVLFVLDHGALQMEHDRLVESIRGQEKELESLKKLKRIAEKEEHPRERASQRKELGILEKEEGTKRTLLKRREELFRQQLLSQEAHQAAVDEYEIAKERVQWKRAEIESLAAKQKAGIVEMSRAIAGTEAKLGALKAELPLAQRALEDATVRAPIDGIVLSQSTERLIGQNVEPGQRIIEVADPSQLQLVLGVDERDVSRVRTGQEVLVNLDAFPYYVYKTFHGKVSEVSRSPAPKASGKDAMEFRILVSIDSSELELMVDGVRQRVTLQPGLSGEGLIVVNPEISLGDVLLRRVEKSAPKSMTLY